MTTTNPLKFMRIRSHQIFVPNRWPGDYQEKEDFLRELVANMLPKCHADSPHGRILVVCEDDNATERPRLGSDHMTLRKSMTPDCFEENQKSFVDGECCMAVCSVEGFLMTDMPLFDFYIFYNIPHLGPKGEDLKYEKLFEVIRDKAFAAERVTRLELLTSNIERAKLYLPDWILGPPPGPWIPFKVGVPADPPRKKKTSPNAAVVPSDQAASSSSKKPVETALKSPALKSPALKSPALKSTSLKSATSAPEKPQSTTSQQNDYVPVVFYGEIDLKDTDPPASVYFGKEQTVVDVKPAASSSSKKPVETASKSNALKSPALKSPVLKSPALKSPALKSATSAPEEPQSTMPKKSNYVPVVFSGGIDPPASVSSGNSGSTSNSPVVIKRYTVPAGCIVGWDDDDEDEEDYNNGRVSTEEDYRYEEDQYDDEYDL